MKSSMERATELKAKLLKKYTEEKEENMKSLQEVWPVKGIGCGQVLGV